MKRVVAGLLVVSTLFSVAAWPQEVISADQASAYVGKTATVRGVVASTRYAPSRKGRPTFLNLEKPYPNQLFTVVIWGSDREKFPVPPERMFEGKTIRVTGVIQEYRGVPEIVVRDPSQIVIEKGSVGPPVR